MCEVLGSIPVNVNERREMGQRGEGQGRWRWREQEREINLGSRLTLTCHRLDNLKRFFSCSGDWKSKVRMLVSDQGPLAAEEHGQHTMVRGQGGAWGG